MAPRDPPFTSLEALVCHGLTVLMDPPGGAEPNCSICFEAYASDPTEAVVRTKACTANAGHIFHMKCLLAWLRIENKNSCPICRHEFFVHPRRVRSGNIAATDNHRAQRLNATVASRNMARPAHMLPPSAQQTPRDSLGIAYVQWAIHVLLNPLLNITQEQRSRAIGILQVASQRTAAQRAQRVQRAQRLQRARQTQQTQQAHNQQPL